LIADAKDLFRSKIGETLEVAPAGVTLFAKGRVALYAILRSLDVGSEDEVIIPAFTCVAVANAIRYTGARPVYADIDGSTYTIDPSSVERAIGPRTRVILAQNTFGLSADIDSLESIAGRSGVHLVDDCTHGIGGSYRERQNGASTAIAFFSTQWSKPVSTGLGGFAVVSDDRVAARMRHLEEAAREPPPIRAATLRLLVAGASHAGSGRGFRWGRSAYRTMSRLGVVPASSERSELDGYTMPLGFLSGMSEWQARMGAERLGGLPRDVERRRAIAHRYSAWLAGHGRTPPAEPATSTHAFLRYPLRVTDRARFTTAARHRSIDLGDWFVSPLHPVRARLDRWGYRPGTAPVAELACAEIVNLPLRPTMSEHEVASVLEFLSSMLDVIR
jgi:dTDP-4-amino-4,6-dideoxygalactose transaminase